ncbi:MAG: hypothetical protein DRG78_17130 [Epsilonproteobacteria bacterium]|nr:MAG: hypothetical protein DRG78_17130 [Campylobacterota bacterium]
MRKGSFAVRACNSNTSAHNSRKNVPRYLLGLEIGTENYYRMTIGDDKFITKCKDAYLEKVGQKMQTLNIENLINEVVITLKKEQDETDVKKLFKKLNEEFGGHQILELSVHRDEGYFVKDDIAYYPTKTILKKDDKYFILSNLDIKNPENEDFDIEVDISEFTKVYNYHAHAKFSMFDKDTSKMARMQKKDMSKRIKVVSEFLGLHYAPDKNSRIKKSVNQIKDEHNEKSKQELKNLATLKILQEQMKRLRAELKLNNATRKDYAILEKLNKELKLKIKNKDLTIEDLNNSTLSYNEMLAEDFIEQNQKLRDDLQPLEDKNKVLTDKVKSLESKLAYSPSMEMLQAKFDLKMKEQILEYNKIKKVTEDMNIKYIEEEEKSIFSKIASTINGTSRDKESDKALDDIKFLISEYVLPNNSFFQNIKNAIIKLRNKAIELLKEKKELEVTNKKLEEQNIQLQIKSNKVHYSKQQLQNNFDRLHKQYESEFSISPKDSIEETSKMQIK